MSKADKLVIAHEGVVYTTSLIVAKYFERKHHIILRDIRNLECSSEFREHNFVLGTYDDSHYQKRSMYNITRDGFMILAMSFTGKRAMYWKEKFIELFNKLTEEVFRLKYQKPIVTTPKLELKHKKNKLITIVDGKAYISTLRLAYLYERGHSSIMTSLCNRMAKHTEEFNIENFKVSTYKGRNGYHYMYNITKDGFIVLSFGFTGERAAQVVEKILDDFDLTIDYLTS